MSLEAKINADIKSAMLAKESKKLEPLRAIKAALLLEKTKEGGQADIAEAAEIRILQRLVKQRKESAELYRSGNREEMADQEMFQASIIETYLPKQLSQEELTEKIRQIINQTGASGIQDLGKVMGAASRELAGKADNKTVSGIVKELLSS